MSSRLAIEVGTGNFHIVEGLFNKGELLIEKAMVFPVPEGCLNTESINDQSLLTESLTEALRIFNPKGKEAVLTFNGISAVIRDIDLPAGKPKELDEMIRTELIQVYHVLPNDVIQYKSVDKFLNETGAQMNKYRAAAIDADIVEGFHSLLTTVKLKPIALDLNVNAIDKLLMGENSINDKIFNGNGTLLLDFGKTTTTVYIISKGKPLFHRNITIGSREIERIIHDETFTSELEVRKLKEEGYNFFEKDETAIKYFNIIKPLFYNLNDEIRKIMGFYSSRTSSGNGSIDKIYIFGGGSKLSGLSEYFESNFNIPTEPIESLSKVKFKQAEAGIGNYMNAIGALIRY